MTNKYNRHLLAFALALLTNVAITILSKFWLSNVKKMLIFYDFSSHYYIGLEQQPMNSCEKNFKSRNLKIYLLFYATTTIVQMYFRFYINGCWMIEIG